MSLILAILLFITTFLILQVTAKPGFGNIGFDKNDDLSPMTTSEIHPTRISWQEILQGIENRKRDKMDSFKPNEQDLFSYKGINFNQMNSILSQKQDLPSFKDIDIIHVRTLPHIPEPVDILSDSTLSPDLSNNCLFYNCNRGTFPYIPVLFGVAILKLTLACIIIFRRMKSRRTVNILSSQVVQDQELLVESEVQPNNDEPLSYAVAKETSQKIPPPPYEP